MKTLFKKQLSENKPITEDILQNLNVKTYFNGEEIKNNDVVLYALLVGDIIVNLITLNERHFHLFELNLQQGTNLPKLKLKKQMNTKELKIEVPSGFEVDKEKSTFELIVFKEIPKISKEKEMSDFLFQKFDEVNNIKIIDDKLIFFKDNEILFILNFKTKEIWIRYSLIWKIFEDNFDPNYQQIRNFIKGWLETNINLYGFTPRYGC